MKERNSFAIDRYIDVFKPGVTATRKGDSEDILAIRREDMIDYDATTGAIRGTFHTVPRVLGDVLWKLIDLVYSWRVPITQGQPADFTRSVQI
jgi:hypothetical protein